MTTRTVSMIVFNNTCTKYLFILKNCTKFYAHNIDVFEVRDMGVQINVMMWKEKLSFFVFVVFYAKYYHNYPTYQLRLFLSSQKGVPMKIGNFHWDWLGKRVLLRIHTSIFTSIHFAKLHSCTVSFLTRLYFVTFLIVSNCKSNSTPEKETQRQPMHSRLLPWYASVSGSAQEFEVS